MGSWEVLFFRVMVWPAVVTLLVSIAVLVVVHLWVLHHLNARFDRIDAILDRIHAIFDRSKSI